MVFDEDSMFPKTCHAAAGPVVLIDQAEYKALVRDSVFARNFAELIADEVSFLPKSFGSMLRLYDKELYRKARSSAEQPRTPTSALAELMRTYTENHGEDGENE